MTGRGARCRGGRAGRHQTRAYLLFVRAGRALYEILKITATRKGPALSYIGMSPLRWIAREYNKQADYLCHHTLQRKSEWQEFSIRPGDFELQPGDVLTGWSDGGFHNTLGETAAYIVQVRRGPRWIRLDTGGIYNDSFRMEAIGMEHMLNVVLTYIR